MSTTYDDNDLMLWILHDFADNAMAPHWEVVTMFYDLLKSPLVEDMDYPHNENYCLQIVIQVFNWKARRRILNEGKEVKDE